MLDDELSPALSTRNRSDMVDKSKSRDGLHEEEHSIAFDVLVRNKQTELRKMLTTKDYDGRYSFQSELDHLNDKITTTIDRFHLGSPRNEKNPAIE